MDKYDEAKIVEALQISNEANDFESKGDIKSCISSYNRAISILDY